MSENTPRHWAQQNLAAIAQGMAETAGPRTAHQAQAETNRLTVQALVAIGQALVSIADEIRANGEGADR